MRVTATILLICDSCPLVIQDRIFLFLTGHFGEGTCIISRLPEESVLLDVGIL